MAQDSLECPLLSDTTQSNSAHSHSIVPGGFDVMS